MPDEDAVSSTAGTDDDDGAPIRPASTVMLLRDGADGLEVFVLHRVAGMAFAPSVTVFPGGGVDAGDSAEIPWSGPEASWWAQEMGCDTGRAAEVVVAAVRELFEETGVLLTDVAEAALPSASDRMAVTEHRMSLAGALQGKDLSLRSDLLRPWANWVTPPGRTKRYDTYFFVAALPAGQSARLLTTEAETGRWVGPATLLAEHAAGQVAIMPPTLAMLSDLALFAAATEVMSAERAFERVAPTAVSRRGQPLRVEINGRLLTQEEIAGRSLPS